MTLLQMMTDVFENSGEHSQLDPGTAGGRVRLVRFLNRAMRRICYYKMPDGHIFRFPNLKKVLFWQAKVYEDASYLVVSSTDDTISTSGLPTDTDRFNGWVVEVAGQYRMVVDSGGGTITVDEDWSTNPVADEEVKLYKSFYDLQGSSATFLADNIPLDPVSTVYQVIAIQDETNNRRLSADDRTATTPDIAPGIPGKYRLDGNRIYLSCPVDESYWYRMEYYGYPTELSLDADAPELPEVFHEAIYMEALRLAFRFRMENSMAYSTKKDLQEYMATVAMPGELKFERSRPRAIVRLR